MRGLNANNNLIVHSTPKDKKQPAGGLDIINNAVNEVSDIEGFSHSNKFTPEPDALHQKTADDLAPPLQSNKKRI